jgi:hypothetical protein
VKGEQTNDLTNNQPPSVSVGVDSDAANAVMDRIRQEFVGESRSDSSGDIKFVKAEEFECVAPT